MAIKTDSYRVVLGFVRLFPDPAVFEDQEHIVQRYFLQNQLSKEKASYIQQGAEEIDPVDDHGKPSIASGTAKYQFEGRTIMAEYMSNANLRIEYVDFGSGLSADDHLKFWNRQRLGEMRFELREFNHQPQTLNIPDVSDLYRLLTEKASFPTLSSIELANVSESVFKATVTFLETELRELAGEHNMDVEIYAARDLSSSQRQSLEKRLTRESTRATVYVILSKALEQDIRNQTQG